MDPRFLQLHTLTAYPAALLNRDDAGFAKRLPFGGAVRTRVSSQCLKRHWRRFTGPRSLREITDEKIDFSKRSRHIFDRLVYPEVAKALDNDDLSSACVNHAQKIFMQGKDDKDTDYATGQKQVIVIGDKEIQFIIDECISIGRELKEVEAVQKDLKDKSKKARIKLIKNKWDEERKDNIKSMAMGAGLDAALFGRMVTSDILARCDAAIHVAHAFTVHKEQREDDYFTAVDDLDEAENKLGAGHVNASELTSGLYYGYVAVDVPLLVSNLTGCAVGDWQQADRALAGRVIEHLVHLIATVSPGAKLGSTAPHALAHAVLAEAGDGQPCTLANAFLEPVAQGGDPIGNAYAALAQELYDIDSNFPSNRPERRHMARGKDDRYAHITAVSKGDESHAVEIGKRLNLDDLATWAAGCVAGAEVAA